MTLQYKFQILKLNFLEQTPCFEIDKEFIKIEGR